MKDYIKYSGDALAAASTQLGKLSGTIADVADMLSAVDTSAEWWSKIGLRSSYGSARELIQTEKKHVTAIRQKTEDTISGIKKTCEIFEEAEEGAISRANFSNIADQDYKSNQSGLDRFLGEFKSRYGWDEALAGSNYIKKIYDFIKNFGQARDWKDWAKEGIDVYQFLTGAVKTFKDYLRIGNAVGTKKAMTWWFKNITGLKPLKYVSKAKNPITAFKNNLWKNKTSPYRAQLKSVIGDFTGASGVGKAVASWASVAVDGVLNWFSNKDEQAQSKGTMSDGRVIAETITETAVGTVLTYGSSIVVGAAVSAVLPVAAPGILVVAASGAVIAGVNSVVAATTGKSVTEWTSDFILDTSIAVGKGVKKIGRSVGNWFANLGFA